MNGSVVYFGLLSVGNFILAAAGGLHPNSTNVAIALFMALGAGLCFKK